MWLTAIVAIGTSISLGGAWALQYFSVDGNPRLIERISYTVVDPSWMPPGAAPIEPLLGEHYFGDLAIVLGYGQVITPYIIAGMPAQYPPLAIVAFKLLGLLGPLIALVLLVALSVLLVPISVWRHMAPLPASLRLVTVVVLVVVTAPMISALDRGGLQFIAIGCLGLFLWARKRGFDVLGIALFVLAASLKSYLLVFALYPLLRGHRLYALKLLGTYVLVNGTLLLLFPGKPTVAFGGFLTSTLFYTSSGMVLDGNSLASVPLRVVEMVSGTVTAEEAFRNQSILLSLATVTWLLVVCWLITRPEIPYWIPLSLLLSASTMIVGAAYPYNYAWAALAAFYFGSSLSDPFPRVRSQRRADGHVTQHDEGMVEPRFVLLRVVTLLTIASALIPQFWIWDGPSGDGRRAISFIPPTMVLVLTIVAVFLAGIQEVRSRRSIRYGGLTGT